MVKKLIRFVTCISIVVAIFVPMTLAAYTAPTNNCDTMVEPKKEETEWVMKMINGALHKRLWSITYEMWLTDWIRVK